MKETLTHSASVILEATLHAITAHKGQFRKEGDIPYVTHPIQVAQIIAKETRYKITPDLIAAAILHDVVEDTKENVNSFPDVVKEIVHLLSDPPQKKDDPSMERVQQTHDQGSKGSDDQISHRIEAIERIRGNRNAIMIKMADRYSNLNEKNSFTAEYLAKSDVQESTRDLLAVAKEAGLENTDTYQCLLGVFP